MVASAPDFSHWGTLYRNTDNIKKWLIFHGFFLLDIKEMAVKVSPRTSTESARVRCLCGLLG